MYLARKSDFTSSVIYHLYDLSRLFDDIDSSYVICQGSRFDIEQEQIKIDMDRELITIKNEITTFDQLVSNDGRIEVIFL